VRHILGELPNSLDETYERILRDINEANREHAHRLLQCLTVTIRPPRVEELAEVLAVDFDAAQLGGIPTVNTNWRWDDQQQAILSTCSSLIAVVDHDGSQVVQFSHFSVKEFLTSERLAHPKRDVSRYHIPLQSAHGILAQACLAALLRLDDRLNGVDHLPLSQYAADYWDDHVRFENVSSSIQNAVEYFLDGDKPHWNAWRRLRNKPNLHLIFHSEKAQEPLFYAAACGSYDIAQRLVARYPHHVNPKCGWWSPLHAALIWKQFHVAQLLYDHGAKPTGHFLSTVLHYACYEGFEDGIEVVRWLLTHRAKVDVRDRYNNTPLHLAVESGRLDIIRILVRSKANIDARGRYGGTPLFIAAAMGRAEIVRTLVEHKAQVNVKNYLGDTPLHIVVKGGRADVAQVLLELHVDVNVRDIVGNTPLHVAVYKANLDIVQMLLEHDANVNAKDNNGDTPLHMAIRIKHLRIARMLLEHSSNASVNSRDSSGRLTRWHKFSALSKRYSRRRRPQPLNAKNKKGRTPLDIASQDENPHNELVELLLEYGAK
jgi:ankyrin repeat protein